MNARPYRVVRIFGTVIVIACSACVVSATVGTPDGAMDASVSEAAMVSEPDPGPPVCFPHTIRNTSLPVACEPVVKRDDGVTCFAQLTCPQDQADAFEYFIACNRGVDHRGCSCWRVQGGIAKGPICTCTQTQNDPCGPANCCWN